MNDLNLSPDQYRQLDKLASNNPNAKQRQKDLITNIVRSHTSLFSYVNEAKISFLVDRLMKKGIGAHEAYKGLNQVVDEYEKLPPFNIILKICRAYKEKKRNGVDCSSAKEDSEVEQIEDEFISIMGEDKLELYVKWWLKEVYNITPGFVEEMGFNPMLFKKPALYDWKDTGRTNNFQRIADTGIKKISKIREDVSKNCIKQSRYKMV